MNIKFKRIAAWGLGIIVASVIGLYGVVIFETRKYTPSLLIACVQVERPLFAWTCKQVLQHGSFKPEHVEALNRDAGAEFALALEDLEAAEKMLLRFMAQGVDINAVDILTRNWSALHSLALQGEVARVKILLRHGARADMRDTEGLTPLDLARIGQAKNPNEPNRAEVVHILEEAGKTPAE